MRAFIPPRVTLEADRQDAIRSLSDIVEFHAEKNPDYLFCIQAEKKPGLDGHSLNRVTYTTLKWAITNCYQWLEAHLSHLQLRTRRGQGDADGSQGPIVLLMESDLGLAVYILALMRLGIPAVLLSTRLSATAIHHLIGRTGATTVIASQRLRSMLDEPAPAVDTKLQNGEPQNKGLQVFTAAGYQTFLNDLDSPLETNVSVQTTNPALILHSSGTSGLPKPIYCTHAHFLAFSQCHEFETAEQRQGLTVSSSPFFHGFGLVPMCLSLGIGKTFCIPPSSELPTGSSIVQLLQASSSKALLTVPSLLEDIASLPDNKGVTALQQLDFVAFGGGLPKPSIGQRLDAAGVRLINHYGATETGPLTPFFVPPAGHDWRFIRLRRDIDHAMEVELMPTTTDGEFSGRAYKLSMRPFGWTERFELQDLLLAREGFPGEFRIAGRTDDLICLATGEKVRPTMLETILQQHDKVKTAVAFGDAQFEIGVIVETTTREVDDGDELREEIWPLVEEAGRQMDAHARVSSPAAILFVGSGALPRSDKGTVLRREVNRVFEREIAGVYRCIDAMASAPAFDLSSPRESVRGFVKAVMAFRGGYWSDEDDFFELGMDSLQATRLRRLLVASLRAAAQEGRNREVDVRSVADDVVYRNPSVSRLAEAILTQNTFQNGLSSLGHLEQIADRYSNVTSETIAQRAVVVMTGSTGSLGSFILAQLVKVPTVAGVIALIRPSAEPAQERQKNALKARNIELSDSEWSKIQIYGADVGAPFLDLDSGVYQQIASKATHVVHAAWPMNFNMSLQSFGSAFRALQNLIQLTSESHRLQPSKRPRFLFISSISTVGNYPSLHGERLVPEEAVSGQNCALELGYAEAKLVCEKIVERAARDYPQIQIAFARVGQIAGSRSGYWNVDEHFVALVASSCKIRLIPDLQGTLSWLPVDATAAAVVDILLNDQPPELVYHLENPVRQSWHEMITLLSSELGFASTQLVSFEEWVEAVMSAPDKGNPAKKLSRFLENEFRKMSCGGIILDTVLARKASPTLRGLGPVETDQVRLYIKYWKHSGVLG